MRPACLAIGTGRPLEAFRRPGRFHTLPPTRRPASTGFPGPPRGSFPTIALCGGQTRAISLASGKFLRLPAPRSCRPRRPPFQHYAGADAPNSLVSERRRGAPDHLAAALAGNARTHSAEQVAQIAASILEFGFVAPILVDERGEIIAGHGRLLAAKSLGLDTVPTIVRAELSDAQKAALRLADNRIALNAGWDEALLRAELAKLQEMGGVDLA